MEIPGITLYDMAKSIVSNEEPIDAIQANKIIEEIATTIKNDHTSSSYYLLICPELRQYVFFHMEEERSTIETIKTTLTEVLKNRGKIIDIDTSEADKKVWEFWIKDIYDDNIYMYQLTDYTENVIEV